MIANHYAMTGEFGLMQLTVTTDRQVVKVLFDWDLLESLAKYKWRPLRQFLVADVAGEPTLLHRYIGQATPLQRLQFKDGNPCNLRRGNIEVIRRRQYRYTPRAHKDSTTQYLGVRLRKHHKKYQAKVTRGGKPTIIGSSYRTAEEAARAYDAWSKRFDPNTNRLNFRD